MPFGTIDDLVQQAIAASKKQEPEGASSASLSLEEFDTLVCPKEAALTKRASHLGMAKLLKALDVLSSLER